MRTAYLLALFALTACTAPSSEVADTSADTGTAEGLYEWLVSEEVHTSDVIFAEPDADELAASKVQDEPRYQVGLSVLVQDLIDLGTATPTSGGAPEAVADGAIRFTSDGFVWSAVVESPGATSLRLGLEGLDLPQGAELYVYNNRGDVAGPYRGTGQPDTRLFYTETLPTDIAHLQIRYEGPDVVAALDQIEFTLAEVAHLDDRFLIGRLQVELPDSRQHCTNLNATCVQNAECDLQADIYDPIVDQLRAASGEMLFQSGSGWYLCTGTLIRSNNGATGHFWTAHHCISTAAEAASLETYWDFTVPCPPGGGPTTTCAYADSANSDIPSSFGATIIDTSATTDFTLMRLTGTPPAGTLHLPWNTTPIATVNGTRLHRVSYPSGAPQAYSQHTVDSAYSLCGAPGNFMYSRDVVGATEGGSSGSAVVNNAGEIVGQLYGACGNNLNDECDTVGNRTYDGAFAATWASRPLVRNALAQEPLPVEVVLSTVSIPTTAKNLSWTLVPPFNNGTTTPTYGNLSFKLTGPNGDADLYVKRGSAPTTTSYDCRPYLTGSNETCTFDPAQSGTYYVMVRAFSAFSGASLKVTTLQPACTDTDADGVCNPADNCPTVANPTQLNSDGDALGNACDTCPNDAANDSDADGVCGNVDNCPTTANSSQLDTDGDTLGNACDTCPNDAANDSDADGVCGNVDNCPTTANSSQLDTDGDTLGNACDTCPNDAANDSDADGVCGNVDNCPTTANSSQTNGDGDLLGDACDACPGDAANDADADGVCGNVDNCPTTANPSQANADGDSLGDACDTTCPNDPTNDIDGDGVCGGVDNCPDVANNGQGDDDLDDLGNACDDCPADADNDLDTDGVCGDVDNCPDHDNTDQEDSDSDLLGDACDACDQDPGNDGDGDGVCGDVDNCPDHDNTDQANADTDAFGDACDNCLNAANPTQANSDGDVFGDACDNCPTITNGQADADADGYGNECDGCPLDADNDFDTDGVCGDVDNCPGQANDQTDSDDDGLGDACDFCDGDDSDLDGLCDGSDNCPDDPNFDQEDSDFDLVGDACDNCPDDDNLDQEDTDTDLIGDACDNCPVDANYDQADADSDLLGDACDTTCPNDPTNDGDGDGVCGAVDNCPIAFNSSQANADDDASGDACDACPYDAANDGDGDGACSNVDNCPTTANAGQLDGDLDGLGDACDDCPADSANDGDLDGWCGDVDNCPTTSNASQANADGDSAGDACDTCTDTDGDGHGNPGFTANSCLADNCPTTANATQTDTDIDGVGDACDTCTDTDGDGRGNPGFTANSCLADNCPTTANATQTDTDIDGVGDACDTCTDSDGDGFGNPSFSLNTCAVDNCSAVANPTQANADGDSAGDACDTCTDTDTDGRGNPGFPANTCADDNCPNSANPTQANADGDADGDACDTCTDTDGDGLGNPGFAANICATDTCPVDNPNDPDGDGVCTSSDACPTVAGNPPDGCLGPKLATGTLTNVGSASWVMVTLPYTYTSAVVVATPSYSSTTSAVVTRVRNVGATSFEVRVQRPNDGAVSGVTVRWVAVEAGNWPTYKLEARRISSTTTQRDDNWNNPTNPSPNYLGSYTTPVVIGQVMTAADPDWSVFYATASSRTNPPSGTQLRIGKHVGADSDTSRSNETLGWIVFEAGSGVIGTRDWRAGLSTDTIQGVSNTPPYSVTPGGSLGPSSVAVGSLAGVDGAEGGWAILYGTAPVSATSLKFAIDEDQLSTTTRAHTAEQVGWFVIED